MGLILGIYKSGFFPRNLFKKYNTYKESQNRYRKSCDIIAFGIHQIAKRVYLDFIEKRKLLQQVIKMCDFTKMIPKLEIIAEKTQTGTDWSGITVKEFDELAKLGFPDSFYEGKF